MKADKQIALYLLALIITVAVCVSFVAQNNTKTNTDMSEIISCLQRQIATSQKDISVRVDNGVLLDRLEQLTRQNTVLLQQVADMTHQLDLYEGGD